MYVTFRYNFAHSLGRILKFYVSVFHKCLSISQRDWETDETVLNCRRNPFRKGNHQSRGIIRKLDRVHIPATLPNFTIFLPKKPGKMPLFRLLLLLNFQKIQRQKTSGAKHLGVPWVLSPEKRGEKRSAQTTRWKAT